jgi:hypothetical protein
MNEPILAWASMRSAVDRAFIFAAARLPAARPMLLGWLWLRLRPMNLLLVLRSAIWRHFAGASSHAMCDCLRHGAEGRSVKGGV